MEPELLTTPCGMQLELGAQPIALELDFQTLEHTVPCLHYFFMFAFFWYKTEKKNLNLKVQVVLK